MFRMYLMTIFNGFSVVAYFGTNYVISIVPNIFIATVLTAFFLFKQINLKVKQIFEAAIALSCTGFKVNQNIRMQRFCELSDRLGKIAVLHLELYKLMNSINAVVSYQVTKPTTKH